MSRLNAIRHYEKKLVRDHLSEEEFNKIARIMENLTVEFVEDTKPYMCPPVERIERKGELYRINGELRFSLYPPIEYKTN